MEFTEEIKEKIKLFLWKQQVDLYDDIYEIYLNFYLDEKIGETEGVWLRLNCNVDRKRYSTQRFISSTVLLSSYVGYEYIIKTELLRAVNQIKNSVRENFVKT